MRSRYVTALAGGILLLLGLFPKLARVVAVVPTFVLGGAGIVMFGMVAATGIRVLREIDYERERHAPYVIAIAIGLGLIPTLSPNFFQHFPDWAAPLTHSGIVLGTVAAVVLNLFLRGAGLREEGG